MSWLMWIVIYEISIYIITGLFVKFKIKATEVNDFVKWCERHPKTAITMGVLNMPLTIIVIAYLKYKKLI